MAPYDEWNDLVDEDEDELQDASMFENKIDVVLFCIDCSESMLKPYNDPQYEGNVQTCHLYTALEAAMQIQKKKIIVGPKDSVGIMLFNTIKKSDTTGQGSDIKQNVFMLQPVSPLSASKIQELIQLLDTAREDIDVLRKTFPPLEKGRVPMGDVFTSCNWLIRDGAPKTASKRVFLITDEDNPHSGVSSGRLNISARTNLVDLAQAGITVEPFFISTDEKGFDISKFYSSILLPTGLEEEEDPQQDSSILPETSSISRIEDLLSQMRFREVPKRSLFSIPFQLGDGFTIGIKGYGLVTEQKKGESGWFADVDNELQLVKPRTIFAEEDSQKEIPKTKMVYGPDSGMTASKSGAEAASDDEDNEETSGGFGARVVKAGQRPFYTSKETRSFRNLGLEPGIKLLGFKDRSELRLEDNVNHSMFLYPDEMAYSGSKRTFSALLKSMIKKDKIGIVLSLTRSNARLVFCALLPQEESGDAADWGDPAGLHLVELPFADDIREAGVTEAYKTSTNLKAAAQAWVDKLTLKKGAYDPDSFPNPGLAFHNEQLQASAFREEYDPDLFEDLTLPKVESMHKRAGNLMKEWKMALNEDPAAEIVVATKTKAAAGTKRKADVSVDEAEIRSKYDDGTLNKLVANQLKDFLRSKGEPVSGTKPILVARVSEWFDSQ